MSMPRWPWAAQARIVWSDPSVAALAATPAFAVTQLARGDAPPAITLPNLEGQKISVEALKGRAVLIIFGELYHARTRLACEQAALLRRLAGLGQRGIQRLCQLRLHRRGLVRLALRGEGDHQNIVGHLGAGRG